MARQSLNPEERALWARVIASVTPLPGRAAEKFPLVPSEVEGRLEPRPRPSTSLGTSESSKTVAKAQNTLDGSWDRRLTRGTVSPDIAVDLHGYTLDAAWRVLDQGLDHAIRSGARVMLLVTGKPRDPSSGRGSIRAAVGDWLAASRHAASIAAVRNAHPRHGGAGALYIVFRRPKSPIQTRQS